MAELKASRTLVKSRPELWAECSDAASLARHLGAFGEIQITKLEPETAVAWEGEDVCGTVTLEPSGWGTRVVLTATVEADSVHGSPPAAEPPTAASTPAVGVGEPAGVVIPEPEPEPDPEPEPESGREPEPDLELETRPERHIEPTAEPAPPGFFRRLFGAWRRSPDHVSEPDPAPERAPAPAPPAPVEPDSPPTGPLTGALDSLGMAHRRPFSNG